MASGCSIEIIKGLDKMVTDLLQVFTRNCGNRLPNKIIFYRDGVNDKQIQTILDNEVNKIKNACRSKSLTFRTTKQVFFSFLWQ
jgi:ATP-dependent Clp protease ATP-binding subunit ClpA